MKKFLVNLLLVVALGVSLSSCYTYSITVGNGPQKGIVESKKNHYLINGLAAVGTVDAKTLAGDAKDYKITITHSFIDGLIASLTFGIYTPTTVTITK